jgi:hypothetical protein
LGSFYLARIRDRPAILPQTHSLDVLMFCVRIGSDCSRAVVQSLSVTVTHD